jgi:hypothetical protein
VPKPKTHLYSRYYPSLFESQNEFEDFPDLIEVIDWSGVGFEQLCSLSSAAILHRR